MAIAALRKLVDGETKLPRFEDDAGFVEERRKLRELAAELQSAEVALVDLKAALRRAHGVKSQVRYRTITPAEQPKGVIEGGVLRRVDPQPQSSPAPEPWQAPDDRAGPHLVLSPQQAGLARFRGEPIPGRLEADRSVSELEWRIMALRHAVALQADALEVERGRVELTIVQAATPEFQALLRQTVAAAQQLADLRDQEHALRQRLSRMGVLSIGGWPVPGRWVDVGSRADWRSPVNQLDRAVAEYLGETWDYSRVVR